MTTNRNGIISALMLCLAPSAGFAQDAVAAAARAWQNCVQNSFAPAGFAAQDRAVAAEIAFDACRTEEGLLLASGNYSSYALRSVALVKSKLKNDMIGGH